jgi:hypothetical protein
VKDARICLVTLAVDDLERAAAFYAALGWKRTRAGNATVIFMQGERMVLSLFGRRDLAADVGSSVEGSSAPFPNVALAINMPSEADVDRLFDMALAAGAVPVKPPEPAFWGGYSGYFSDPDGHLWELAHNPFFRLTKRGHIDLLKTAG